MQTKFEQLEKIFPEVITEKLFDGKIKKAVDFDKLKDILSENISDSPERYEFFWVGKNAARAEAYKEIDKTLRPCVEESKNFDTTENLYIEGDNLEVLKLLQQSYLHKVKMIYIDPPYNTGNDFIYRDKFRKNAEEIAEEIVLFDNDGNKNLDEKFNENLISNPRFHSDWCSMIYSRLLLARNLLTEDGVIFISIDDNEQANLKKICDEVFGEKNFVGQWNWYKSATPPNLSKKIKKNIEYIICYEKFKNNFRYRGIQKNSPSSNGLLNQTNKFAVLNFPANVVESGLPDGKYFAGAYGTDNYEINLLDNVTVKNGIFSNPFRLQAKFKWSQENLLNEIARGTRIFIRTKTFSPSYEKIEYAPEVPPNFIDKSVNVNTTEEAGKYLNNLFEGVKIFDYPKPIDLIKYIMNFVCDKDAIILDFFSGSATTAHAVMQLNAEDGGNRKFIMVQLPEKCAEKSEAFKAGYKNICEIGKERIRRAGEKIKSESPLTTENLDVGFRVLKLDETNFKNISVSPAELTQEMLKNFADNIKADRNGLDLLFECLINWGVELHLPYAQEEFEGATIHIYDEDALIACFDKNISEEVVKFMAQKKPLRAVFRDACFSRDDEKINASEIFKLYAPNTKFKVV